MSLTGSIAHSRWWAQPVAIRMVSGMQAAADRSCCHPRRLALQKCWPHKLSCSANLFKGGSSSEVDKMFTNLRQPVTQISWVPSPHYSTGPRNHLMQMLGFAPLSPSFHCYKYHALKQVRLALTHNSFAVQCVFGGIIIMACSLLIMLLLGRNSTMPSEAIIFLRVLWRGS